MQGGRIYSSALKCVKEGRLPGGGELSLQGQENLQAQLFLSEGTPWRDQSPRGCLSQEPASWSGCLVWPWPSTTPVLITAASHIHQPPLPSALAPPPSHLKLLCEIAFLTFAASSRSITARRGRQLPDPAPGLRWSQMVASIIFLTIRGGGGSVEDEEGRGQWPPGLEI